MRHSGRTVRWLDGSAVRIFHVWHPPSYAAKDIIKARSANLQLATNDKSTFRSIRFPNSRGKPLPSPNLASAPRPLVTVAIASSIVADFNCEDQLFHLVTAPVRGHERPNEVKRMLERHTGETFRTLAESELGTSGRQNQ